MSGSSRHGSLAICAYLKCTSFALTNTPYAQCAPGVEHAGRMEVSGKVFQ